MHVYIHVNRWLEKCIMTLFSLSYHLPLQFKPAWAWTQPPVRRRWLADIYSPGQQWCYAASLWLSVTSTSCDGSWVSMIEAPVLGAGIWSASVCSAAGSSCRPAVAFGHDPLSWISSRDSHSSRRGTTVFIPMVTSLKFIWTWSDTGQMDLDGAILWMVDFLHSHIQLIQFYHTVRPMPWSHGPMHPARLLSWKPQ